MDYTKILLAKFPNDTWTLNGESYAGLTWLSDTPKPTKKQLDDLWVEVQAEIEAEQTKIVSDKAAAQAKLAALGLTADDLKAVGL
jgi:hypothetical protein